jgi:hypothetical protein
MHDGRVFADDQALPKFGEPDPDFKGSQFFPVQMNTPILPAKK